MTTLKSARARWRAIAGRIVVAILAAALAAGTVQAQVVCQGCDRSMSVDEREWSCLKRKLKSGELSGVKTPVVFLSLSKQACEGATRSIFSEPPPASATASRVYTLSQQQLRCLSDIANDKDLADLRELSIDFAKACQ